MDVPSYATSSRHGYGGSKRGIIWEYQNDDIASYPNTLELSSWISRNNVRFVT